MDEKINDFENKLGVPIPESEKKFLRKYNGGETPRTSYKQYDVSGFYGLGKVKYSLDNEEIYIWNSMKLFPIARDSFGNKFLLSTGDEKVYFMNHEEDNLYTLDTSLEGFILGCESKKIKPGSRKTPEEREKELIAKNRGNVITDDLRDAWKAEYEKYSMIELENVVL